MSCDEWSKSVAKYRRTVQAYNAAVFDLGWVPGSEFDQSWQRAERARKDVDGARAELLEHEDDHARVMVQSYYIGDCRIPGIATEDLVLGDQGQGGG
jgi:hypothetical protein